MKAYKSIIFFYLIPLFILLFFSTNSWGDPLENWHLRHSAQQELFLTRITHGNNIFIAIGENGMILTSTDGLNWIQGNSGTTEKLNGVAYGNNMFIVVGDNGTLLSSQDGVAWNRIYLDTSNHLIGITYANGLFVVVGQQDIVFTSHDGILWTFQRAGGSKDYYLIDVAYGNGSFVAVGYGYYEGNQTPHSIILTSKNGIDWTDVNLILNGYLIGVAYGNNMFVAVGQNGTVLTSNDGMIWSQKIRRAIICFMILHIATILLSL